MAQVTVAEARQTCPEKGLFLPPAPRCEVLNTDKARPVISSVWANPFGVFVNAGQESNSGEAYEASIADEK